MSCTCFIIPKDVLEKLSEDSELSEELRQASGDTARVSTELRNLRAQAGFLTNAMSTLGAIQEHLAPFPAVKVYDCKKHQTLPGTAVRHRNSSPDLSASRTFKETTAVANFYKQVFGRNSIDGTGMTMMSSIHFGDNYNNAMWNGTQMIYGDGDRQIFIDFTVANDIIAHELTHGVTQYTLQLAYSDEAGGLNESISDCFGTMFRQWQANQDVNQADWLIGHDILGPVARAKGYTCLRNMANPADPHCLAPQPVNYSTITPDMDPHYSSGPPNRAFYLACKSAGGKSWEKVGQIWYRAMTGFGPSPDMTMKEFADRARQLAGEMYDTVPSVAIAVDKAWKEIGL